MLEIHPGRLQLHGMRGGIMLVLKRWNCKLFLQVSVEYIFIVESIFIVQLKVWNCVLRDVCLCLCVCLIVYVERGQGFVKFAN